MSRLGAACLTLAVLIASPALAATPVELWKGGDDGLTNHAYDVLEKAFGGATDFSLARSGEGVLKVAITNHLRSDTTFRVTAPYEISRAGAAPLVGEATCTETTLPVCADKILSATRTYLKNR
jgi:hypothetical protein